MKNDSNESAAMQSPHTVAFPHHNNMKGSNQKKEEKETEDIKLDPVRTEKGSTFLSSLYLIHPIKISNHS